MSYNRNKKGQVGVVTAVLLSGMVVAGVGSALMWGLPLLEKEQDERVLEDSLSQMEELTEAIEDVSVVGGSTTMDIELEGGSLLVDDERNMIEFSANTEVAYVSTDDWTPLNEREVRGLDFEGSDTVNSSDSYGIIGTDRAGVLLGNADLREDEYNTRFRIAFRELNDLTTDEGFQVDLRTDDDIMVSPGTHTLYIESQGTETDGVSQRGGPLEKRIVSISLG